ncbi:MAG: hypothetical protein ACP5IV_07895 [Caldisericia bacterium]
MNKKLFIIIFSAIVEISLLISEKILVSLSLLFFIIIFAVYKLFSILKIEYPEYKKAIKYNKHQIKSTILLLKLMRKELKDKKILNLIDKEIEKKQWALKMLEE